MRWLRPPPAATAAFSSARSPGVVLRVSRIAAPGASHGLDEAGGQRRDPGQVAEQVERRALAGEQRARRAGDQRDVRRAPSRATRPRPRAARSPRRRPARTPRPRRRARTRPRAASARSAPGRGPPRGTVASEVTSPAPRSSASARATSSRRSLAVHQLAREDGDRRGEPVQEVAAADRADLAGAEEAAGGRAERVLDRRRVVVGRRRTCATPRPLQVNSSAPAAPSGAERRGLQRRAPRAGPRRRRRRRGRACAPSARPAPARRARSVPASGSAPMIGRTRKSPRSYSGWFSSITIPSISPLRGELLLARLELGDRLAQPLDRRLRGQLLDHVAVARR